MFTNGRGNQYTNVMVAKRMKATCEDAGIPYGDKLLSDEGERIGVVFHCFRLTRTTRWVEAGFSDEIIRRAAGHKSLEAYRDYVRLDPTTVMTLVRENCIIQRRIKRITI